MGTFAAFYVKTNNLEKVVEVLEQGMPKPIKKSVGNFPKDYRGMFLAFDEDPNYLLIGKHQENWTTIIQNSFSPIEKKILKVSSELNTKVLVTLMQTTSDTYYYADYEEGKKIREIYKCYSDDSEELNYGKKYPFETDEVGIKTEHGYFFDWDGIEYYTKENGLKSLFPENDIEWIILNSEKISKTSTEVVQELINNQKKKSFWRKVLSFFKK